MLNRLLRAPALLIASLLLGGAAHAQAQDSVDLVDGLRSGGFVLAMRHARAPRGAPDAAAASAGNTALERQLDEAGRESAAAMGEALRALGVPIGEVLASPTFRALETVEWLAVGEARPIEELGDGGRDMRPDEEGRRSAWLEERAAMPPRAGTNTLLVTHVPNLVGAFGEAAQGMADGETLIIEPRGGDAVVLGRVKIEEWPALARR